MQNTIAQSFDGKYKILRSYTSVTNILIGPATLNIPHFCLFRSVTKYKT